MMQDVNFRVTGRGDTYFATAPGFRAKKIMVLGEVTPTGQWMRDQRMLQMPADRIDPTLQTEFRGNSEYAMTQSGKRVKLRDTRGLTARGKQMYQAPELTVEVPAIQEGTNASGDQYTLDTVKVHGSRIPRNGRAVPAAAHARAGHAGSCRPLQKQIWRR